MLIEAKFIFDTEEEGAHIDLITINRWASDVNETFACFVIGYEGWSVNEIIENHPADAS